jgi:hypothetical protein
VLNKPELRVGLDCTFLTMGGDSMAALQAVMQRCTEGICLTVHNTMRGGSQFHIASRVAPLDFASAGPNTWNLSIVLRVKRTRFKSCDNNRALEAVMLRHSMLRARFVCRNHSGDGTASITATNHNHRNSSDGSRAWAQLIAANARSAYQLSFHGGVASLAHAEAITAAGQRRLDIMLGPLLAADVLGVADGAQLIALAAHHFAVDLVSWRIIAGDLARALTAAESNGQPSASALTTHALLPQRLLFYVWCQLQAQHAAKRLAPSRALPEFARVPPLANYRHWGLQSRADNVIEDGLTEHFRLDAAATAATLGGSGSGSRAKLVDVLLSPLCYSFHRSFRDRGPPLVFNEHHGREPWRADIDLSDTVGWFTTMHHDLSPSMAPAAAVAAATAATTAMTWRESLAG